MIVRAAVAVSTALMLALPLAAQTIEWRMLGQALSDQRPVQPPMSSGTIASLRGLDKVSGAVSDLEIPVGESAVLGRLRVSVSDCRFPTENPASEAYVFMTIEDAIDAEVLFAGWMIASSPALNPLDHARYDIWVMGCA